MPARKRPNSLQNSALRRIGLLFKSTCHKVCDHVLSCLEFQSQNLSFAQLKALKTSLLSEPITQIQECFFLNTAHFFHEQIVIECLVSTDKLTETK